VLPIAAEPTRVEPIGRRALIPSIGAVLGMIAIAAGVRALGPLRLDLAAIRGEDDTSNAAPTLASLGRTSPVRDDAKALAVRATLSPIWAAHERALLPFLAPHHNASRPDRDGIAAWATLRRAYSSALAAQRQAPEEYALTARDRPAPYDPLLIPDIPNSHP
jgi:hypothetical protein